MTLVLIALAGPAVAEWRLDEGNAIAIPSGRGTSNIEAIVISCQDPYIFEVYAEGGPVRPLAGGVEVDYFYQPDRIRAVVDGASFPFVAAGSGDAVVLFSEGTAEESYMGNNDPAFIDALKAGVEMRLAFDIVDGATDGDGSAYETYALFPLAGAADALGGALADCPS